MFIDSDFEDFEAAHVTRLVDGFTSPQGGSPTCMARSAYRGEDYLESGDPVYGSFVSDCFVKPALEFFKQRGAHGNGYSVLGPITAGVAVARSTLESLYFPRSYGVDVSLLMQVDDMRTECGAIEQVKYSDKMLANPPQSVAGKTKLLRQIFGAMLLHEGASWASVRSGLVAAVRKGSVCDQRGQAPAVSETPNKIVAMLDSEQQADFDEDTFPPIRTNGFVQRNRPALRKAAQAATSAALI